MVERSHRGGTARKKPHEKQTEMHVILPVDRIRLHEFDEQFANAGAGFSRETGVYASLCDRMEGQGRGG